MSHLRVPVRNVLVPSFCLLPESSYDIAQRTETLVDILSLLQSLSVRSCPTRIQPFAPSQIHQVQTTFAVLTRAPVLANDAQGKHGVRTRGSIIHKCRGHGAP